MAKSSERLVLLIHGTAAADPDDRGTKWWQCESAFWTDLNRQLAPDAACGSPDGGVFHWSGLNSEGARRQAGRALYQWLRKLDDEGREVHLVAHSHGGSVIWHALLESLAAKHPLAGLRSWITVGTPFLRFRSDRHAWWMILPLVAAAFVAVATIDRAQLLIQTWTAMFRENLGRSAVSLVGLWSLIAIAIGVSLVRLVRTAFAHLRQRRRDALAEAAWREYGDRWCGLSSSEDEAINGLATTLALEGAIMPRASGGGNSATGRFASILTAPFRFLQNRLIAPLGDQFIWDRVTRHMQGADVFGLRLASVDRTPVAAAPTRTVPRKVNEELRELANRKAAEVMTDFRDGLGKPDIFARLQRRLSWNELIHTSYFDVAPMRNLLARRIREGSLGGEVETQAETAALAQRANGALLPATAAVVLAGLLGGTQFIAKSVYDSSVGTFRDEYQVERAIAEAPLQDALKDGNVGERDLLDAWVGALVDSGHSKEASDVAVTHEAALGSVVARFFVADQGERVGELLARPELRQRETVYDCQLAEAVADLLKADRPANARTVTNMLIERQRGGVKPDSRCRGELGDDSVSSPREALEKAHYLMARYDAAHGATSVEVIRECQASGEPGRNAAYSDAFSDFLAKDAVEKARDVLRAAPLRIATDVDHNIVLAAALSKRKKIQEATEIVNGIVSSVPEPDRKQVADKLIQTGFAAQAFTLIKPLTMTKDEWERYARAFGETGDFTLANQALEHIPAGGGGYTLQQLAIAAVQRHQIAAANDFARKGGTIYALSDVPSSFAEAGALAAAIRLAKTSASPVVEMDYVLEKAKTAADARLVATELLALLESGTPLQRVQSLPNVLKTMTAPSDRQALESLAKQLVMSAKDALPVAKAQPWEYHDDYANAAYALIRFGFPAEGDAIFRMAPKWGEAVNDAAELIAALAGAGQLERALELCKYSHVESSADCGIGATLPIRGRQEALAAAETMRKSGRDADAAIYLVRSNLRADADRVLQAMTSRARGATLELRLISTIYIRAHDGASALRAARLIADKEPRDDEMLDLLTTFASEGNGELAVAAGASISDPEKRTRNLLLVARGDEMQASQNLDVPAERSLLEVALEASHSIESEQDRMRYSCEIAPELAIRGAFRLARLTSAPCPSFSKMSMSIALLDAYAKRNKGK
jgi:hypothetical protein